jgi:hypothetical protein
MDIRLGVSLDQRPDRMFLASGDPTHSPAGGERMSAEFENQTAVADAEGIAILTTRAAFAARFFMEN